MKTDTRTEFDKGYEVGYAEAKEVAMKTEKLNLTEIKLLRSAIISREADLLERHIDLSNTKGRTKEDDAEMDMIVKGMNKCTNAYNKLIKMEQELLQGVIDRLGEEE